jgi:hypothetical protein
MVDPTTYQVSISNKSTEIDCPHPGCFKTIPPAYTMYQMWKDLRKHFRGKHPRDTIIALNAVYSVSQLTRWHIGQLITVLNLVLPEIGIFGNILKSRKQKKLNISLMAKKSTE